MPLRQSTLSFKGTLPATDTAIPTQKPVPSKSAAMPSPPAEEVDSDTIVVNVQPDAAYQQLPTPAESATDVSSQRSASSGLDCVPRSRSKRVSSAKISATISKETLVEPTSSMPANDKSRSISGQTLVSSQSACQRRLTQKDVASLDHSWHTSDDVVHGGKADIIKRDDLEDDVGSTITVNDEDTKEREERQIQKKARMEENAQAWEERKKMAEEKATRRSSRASILITKAGDIVSGITSNVLGKRTRDVIDGSGRSTEPQAGRSTRTSNAVEPFSARPQDQTNPKRRRMSEETIVPITATRRMKLPKDKRWLNSGLYTGQSRLFNPLLTESKNKNKNMSTNTSGEDNVIMPLPMFAGERLLKQGRDFKLPFDVFSPLPPGQPKPDEWKKVNRNVFIGDAAGEWRTSKYGEHSTCLCTAETGCDQDCMNRYMYYECDERNCNLTEEQCNNRAFEGLKQRVKKGRRYHVGVEVIKTIDRGYGVRSSRTFDPNQIIVEYTGEIITQEECETRMRTMYKDNECYYLMLFDQNMIIDATRGSMARFVNHSCEPNCRMEKWTVGGKPRMALFAGDRGIMTGEELTYDYNFDPYSQKNVQECRCGAKNCRGVLGPKTKDDRKRSSNTPDEDKTSKKEGKLAGMKRKIVEVLEESTSRLNKKSKISVPEAVVYKSPLKKQATAKLPKAVQVTRVHVRKVSVKKPGVIVRKPSKLRRIDSETKDNNVKSGKRMISTSSSTSTAALIPKANIKGGTLKRSGSLRERAGTITKNMVRSMRR